MAVFLGVDIVNFFIFFLRSSKEGVIPVLRYWVLPQPTTSPSTPSLIAWLVVVDPISEPLLCCCDFAVVFPGVE